MSIDDGSSKQDGEGFLGFLRKNLAFLIRNAPTIALIFLLLIPLFNLLPENLQKFTFDHPSLLLGPALILTPIFLAYGLNWDPVISVKNIIPLALLLMIGLIVSAVFPFGGLMTARFICPDGYPLTGGSIGGHILATSKKIICQGEPGAHEIPRNILVWTTYAVFLILGLLSAGVSFVFGRQSRLLGRAGDGGQWHFVRFFLIAMVLCMVFLSLPEFFPGANFLARRFESSGKKYPMLKRLIARYSPIHGAVLSGNAERVRALLEKGANVNAIVNVGQAPLGFAVKQENFGIVRMLVEAGADVNLGEKIKQSAMQLARKGKNADLIAYLEKHGGNPLPANELRFEVFAATVAKNDLEAARDLLEKDEYFDILTKNEGPFLLFRTIFRVQNAYYQRPRGSQIQSLKMARLLLNHGANLDFRGVAGRTPLVKAIRSDNPWMVKLFLTQGADINTRDDKGRNPLYHALKGRFFRKTILAMLVKNGVKINHQDNLGKTVLIAFSETGRSTWPIQWLLRHGADVNLVDKSGQTALDKLGSKRWDDKKRKLLLEAGAKSALTR